jgi:hypothetical protein
MVPTALIDQAPQWMSTVDKNDEGPPFLLLSRAGTMTGPRSFFTDSTPPAERPGDGSNLPSPR